MSNTYRIRTEIGKDKYVNVLLEQDFEQLEILSLKILQSQIYNRLCSDYGVVAGRITANSGFGLPNCKVSIFIPLSNEDENNPVISDLYPYKLLSDINDDGYRYNLLPYVKSHNGHNPTGSFPDRIDILTDPYLIEVYDKYYKFTVKTNDSGDFMIFGVPLGTQTIHVDIDLSDIGEFSLSPQDLIRLGVATESQVAGTEFRTSTDLNTLPQIISLNRTINIEPLWGQPEVCTIGITRTDFDITQEAGIEITPTAIFMGSIFSNGNDQFQTQRCRPKIRSGDLCNLIAGPGEILAIRQTIFNDDTGRPVLETFALESGGQVIDENGAWLIDVPMNLDYVTTNEFGDRVISNDPKVGIPTRGKYRFKVKWNQSPTLSEDIKRGYFLVPNIREYGWEINDNRDPLVIQDWIQNPLAIPPVVDPNFYQYNELARKSYSFSLDWNDYVDPQAAINCEDTFYLMSFNKVYTVSQLIDQYRRGFLPNEFVGIKNNLDESCESDNVKFPNNDSNYRFDIVYLLALVAMFIFKPILYGLVPILHVVAAILAILGPVFGIIVGVILYIVLPICYVIAGIVSFLNALGAGLEPIDCIDPEEINKIVDDLFNLYKKILNINLPLLVYPNCELCSCEPGGELSTQPQNVQSSGNYVTAASESGGFGVLSTYMLPTQYDVKDVDAQFRSGIQALLSGAAYTRDEPSGKARVPQYSLFGTDTDCSGVCGNGEGNNPDPCPKVLFTNNLTLAERINLFNVKAKYFDESANNPGGGINRIKVTFNTSLNDSTTKYHLDNMLVISCKEGSLPNFTAGQIISFQDPNLSSDININGFSQLNQFGTAAVTGTTYRSGIQNIPLSYANPNGSGSIFVVNGYDLNFSGDPQFHKFPMDIEYYQVITAMTYSNYTGQCQSASLSNNKTLPHRFLGNDTLLREVNKIYSYSYYPPSPPHQGFPPARIYNPMKLYKKSNEQVIVFLVRGVDPYSTRQINQYDLSRLFGYDLNNFGLPEGQIVVSGNYKLNIPIQPSTTSTNLNGFRSVRHSFGISNNILTNSDSTTGIPLYYDSFNFELSTSGLAKFSGFTSTMPSYYSSLDSSVSSNFKPSDVPSSSPLILNKFAGTPGGYNSTEVLIIKSPGTPIQPSFSQNPILPFQNNNAPYYWGFSVEIDSQIGNFFVNGLNTNCNRDYFGALPNDYQYDTRGYYVGEIIDGGSLMGQEKSKITSVSQDFYADGWYFCPRYTNTYDFQAATNSVTARKIIMRSDRLPTSSTVTDVQGNSLPLQSNLIFSVFKLSDDGLSQGSVGTPSFIGGGADPNSSNLVISESVPNPVFESFSCENAVPLFCYTTINNEISIKPDDNICYTNGVTGKKIMKNGCYQLITEVLLSLPADLLIVNEWTSRLLVNFGACRNVWSHLFINNWINGSLYAFAFKNDRIFDLNNRPTSVYCRRTLYLHPTNNFYYRSSPYVTGSTIGFIGAQPTTFLGISFGGNNKNLKFPTTIMDLGPRSQYLQELVFSDEFDGYVVNRLGDSSYTDVSEILNFLIISRITNLWFIVERLLSPVGATVFNFFSNSRAPFKNLVDADYAQMISISSELGIATFEPANYPADPNGQDPLYVNSPLASDGVIGIFWSSNTQVRDFITPKRNIINSNANLGSICAFSNIPIFSQEVPFYQWQIKNNASFPIPFESIFGSQNNNWYTNPINTNGTFFSSKYQSMDRLNPNSRYFRYRTTNGTGYIFATDSNGDEDGDRGLWTHNNPDENTITVGAPFHFYFGLKKGKTSFDRFARKWIKFETITD